MSKPRVSGIPTPGRTGIPTPGRSRSSSAAGGVTVETDDEYMSRAFADALKANNPSQHKSSRVSDISSTSGLSPLTASYSASSMSGRSSVASSSSAVSSNARKPPMERAKTPTSTRAPSRQSDIFARSSSRASRVFDVGDAVRIESLGFEGTLRFIGEIDGKPGLWAGVELSPGFAGKGKNNGSVAGKQYFSCPDKCGVFVATTKLSAPSVRPSSVASSHAGRRTPSISGRGTPSTSFTRPRQSINSFSNGRVTPGGRTTPSLPETPAVRAARLRAMANKTNAGVTPVASSKTAKNLTEGSIAAKYAGMTAQQLSARKGAENKMSPSRSISGASSIASPTRIGRTSGSGSPSRPPGSPFSTPKPRLGTPNGSNGPSGITPKPRVPSAVAMPPPSSPSFRKLQNGDDDVISSTDLEQRGKSLQDKIASLTNNKTSSPWGRSSPRRSERPESSASVRSSRTDDKDMIDQLQSRIAALEYDNQRLRSQVQPSDSETATGLDMAELTEAHAVATAKISELEAMLETIDSSQASRDAEIEALNSSHAEILRELQVRYNAEQEKMKALQSELSNNRDDLRALQEKLEGSDALVDNLKFQLDEKDAKEKEEADKAAAERAEWAATQSKLKDTMSMLEEDKKDLGMQVDELRHAGQETIALYEERLRAGDLKRYDLEDRIAELEAKLTAQASRSPRTSQVGAATPTLAEIDNEALREQVLHYQKKVSMYEDMIEDSRASQERDETQVRERMTRAKDKEDALKKEVSEARREIDRVLKAEASARNRIEEIEEAFRESTVALENARAEVEGLRSELDNLNGLVASQSSNGDQMEAIRNLEAENLELKKKLTDQVSRIATLQQHLDDQSDEFEALKKRMNRDVSINNGIQSPSTPTKHSDASTRDEIKGLKHIIQELQKETSAVAQQKQILESENELLKSETDKLREEVKILEENLDQSILREEQKLEDDTAVPDDPEGTRRLLKEQRLKYETDVEQTRKKLADAEMKHARTTHDLNKEISELEALVESKIYREDELEQEIERLKAKLSRQKKSSKSASETEQQHSRDRAGSTSTISVHSNGDASEAVCEICERPGHDIFNCDLLRDGPVSATANGSATSELFCEECEGRGHLAADCPHSMDVF